MRQLFKGSNLITCINNDFWHIDANIWHQAQIRLTIAMVIVNRLTHHIIGINQLNRS